MHDNRELFNVYRYPRSRVEDGDCNWTCSLYAAWRVQEYSWTWWYTESYFSYLFLASQMNGELGRESYGQGRYYARNTFGQIPKGCWAHITISSVLGQNHVHCTQCLQQGGKSEERRKWSLWIKVVHTTGIRAWDDIIATIKAIHVHVCSSKFRHNS